MKHDIHFTKMQGVGNDFIVMEKECNPDLNWSRLAPLLCDRRRGIGSDGILLLSSPENVDLHMSMLNPDGTSDFCGNGLRCSAQYAVERGLHPRNDMGQTCLFISTKAGIRQAIINSQGVTVTMGKPDFSPDGIPASSSVPLLDFSLPLKNSFQSSLSLSVLSTGSAHGVTFVNRLPDDPTFQAVSYEVENHPLFPERISLMWVLLEKGNLATIRIWERGVGETWGCGTGACAVAAVIFRQSSDCDEVCVKSRGGELYIRQREDGELMMRGPAEFVYDGLCQVDISSDGSGSIA